MSGDAECKACGKPLLEGRAYELGGHRWHVECFRCSVCENQLHAHTNMLVLGDGTLVCSNCSYTCSLCSRKITDMAILTNDQAFCADCFVCRNCKRQIDDLQYARTSQGIFCMNCHNALLARKRLRQQQQKQQQQQKPTAAQLNGSHHDSAKSSKSSLESSSWTSVNRNKDLPGLPDLAAAAAALDLDGELDARDRRELKVPRKKLAPSAFAETVDAPEPKTPDRTQPNRRSPAKMLEPLGTPPRSNSVANLNGNLSGNAVAEPPTPEAAASLGHHSTPPHSAPASAPASAASSVTSAAPPAPASAGLSVPQRSQLRPASPVRSWRSIKSPGRPAAGKDSQTNGLPGSPASMPATALSPAKSTISKFWHRRDPSTGSVDAVSVPISAPLTPSLGSISAPASGMHPGHGRSLSESGQPKPGVSDGDSDALLASLVAERQRADDLEAQLNALFAEIGSIDALQVKREGLSAETAEMEAILARMRDEQRILGSKNTQLVEMNQELERRTLEKFGPNSLWGSQNPPPARPASPALHAPPSDQPPLVTRLDGGAGTNGSAGQPQHPLRSAKHWFLRRPNKGQQNGVIGGVVSGVGAMAGAVGGLAGTNGTAANAGTSNGMYNGASSSAAGSASGSDDSSAQPRTLIGDSLAQRVDADQAPVPYIVTRCFAEVERRGLDTEGIYRKPGSKSQVDAIMEYFASGSDTELEETMLGGEIQAVTSAVKQYLRYLADPVITYDCYDSFIAAGNSRSVQVLRRTVQALPGEHRDVLRAIASHLALVASHESSNLMNIRNLAMVFAPTIARDETGEREIADMQARNEATQLLITNASTLLDPAVDELL